MRAVNRMRDLLTPWLVLAIASIIVLPLVYAAGCDLACSLGVMPTGSCSHETFTHDHSRGGELVSVFPLLQQATASAIVMLLAALMLAAPAATGFVHHGALVPRRDSDTPLRV